MRAPAFACILACILCFWTPIFTEPKTTLSSSLQPFAIPLTISIVKGAEIIVVTTTLSITGVRTGASHKINFTNPMDSLNRVSTQTLAVSSIRQPRFDTTPWPVCAYGTRQRTCG